MSSSLSFQFVGNACGIFKGKNNTSILCDPWIIDGVFEGSWCHYPPLKTTLKDIQDVDAIYISHLHSDHFDERYFEFPLNTPLIILDHSPNFLIKKLESMGYTNLVKVKDGQTVSFKEFQLTCFRPFAKNVFLEAKVGNIIDSALVIECDDVIALNTNDNMLTLESASMIADRFGKIDLAMLNYNAAGPYPSCFDNLSEREKLSECQKIVKRNLDHLVLLLQTMKPKAFLPFAGSYVIGGKEKHKNRYLGTITWDECASYISGQNVDCKIILLHDGHTYDLVTGTSDHVYEPIDVAEMERYIESELSHLEYTYQRDEIPSRDLLINELKNATKKMREKMKYFGIQTSTNVYVEIFGVQYQIHPLFQKAENNLTGPRLETRLDERLLKRILHRRSYWNNAEVGVHINFVRVPNTYEVDLHTALQFLHL